MTPRKRRSASTGITAGPGGTSATSAPSVEDASRLSRLARSSLPTTQTSPADSPISGWPSRLLRDRHRQTGRTPAPALAAFVRDHLVAKKRAGKVTDGWIAALEGFLRRTVLHFGAERPLDEIRPSDVRSFAEWLSRQPARRPRASGRIRYERLQSGR
jgi:hypothetical protein